jgi:hypothetical protein
MLWLDYLKKEQFDFKINNVHSDVQKACLKINDCFTFCNETLEF